jgi:transposase
MSKYKPVDFNQITMIPVDFNKQIIKGSFEYTLHHLIEKRLNLSIFDRRYKNGKTGAPAYNPKYLLKIILFAYSLGITSTRRIEALCQSHIVFIALSGDTRPHFTTIAKFIAQLPGEIETLFADVLAVCDCLGLIGKEMFAIDGCKISSNASKEWSGTKAHFEKKRKKVKKEIHRLIEKHQADDKAEIAGDEIIRQAEEKKIHTMLKKIEKIETWLHENTDKKGARNNPVQSNITDNESAKLKTSGGTIQGYSGICISDNKRQVITAAGAIGQVDERPMVKPMLEQMKNHFPNENVFERAKFSGDNGFCSEEILAYLAKSGIDAYIPDHGFRKRDQRFKEAESHYPKERQKTKGKFQPRDFMVDPLNLTCHCPAGKKMRLKSKYPKSVEAPVIQYMAHVADCKRCRFRNQCLRKPDQKNPRQYTWFQTESPDHQPYTKQMQQKIDSESGRYEYSKRMGTIEPVFANITSTIGLNRFSLRGRIKVTAQWLAFCIVHNVGKIQRYGMAT